jgi:hypothetical protein
VLIGELVWSSLTFVQLFQKPICEKSLSGELPFTPEEINTMFAGVTNIIAINTELLKGLVLRLKNWSDTQKLGDLILNMVSYICTNSKNIFTNARRRLG